MEVELAADGGAEALVGRLLASEEEDAAVLVAEVAEDGDLVGEGVWVGSFVGHAGRENSGKGDVEGVFCARGARGADTLWTMTPASSAVGTRSDVSTDGSWAVRGKRCYLIGIGGCGMSGLARMLRGRGALVRGSDAYPSPFTESLKREGVEVGFEQTAERLPEDVDVVVASAAIKPDNGQMMEAVRRGVEVIGYAEALGRCLLGWTGVAIAGTHGKSTTTAMLGVALTEAGLDPTVIVGATCAQLSEDGKTGSGFRLGSEKVPTGPLEGAPGVILAEACEFNRSFHNYRPRVASISSVEADHLDIYGSLDAVVQAFREFAALVAPAEEGGKLIIAHEGAHRREVTAGARCAVETIGFSPAADWGITYFREGRRVTLRRGREEVASWKLSLPGEHMAFNSALACALGITLGADPRKLEHALAGFRGVDRRVQKLGERNGVIVYDDYGHHPTEIDATLRALREYHRPGERGGRLICVFQPHQHSRTRFLMEEFAQAFSQADVVIVPHIYFVRDSEMEKARVSAADLVDRLRERGIRAMHLYPFGAIVEQLEGMARPGDVVAVMGAGPVWEVARDFMDAGKGR